jgi:hypothetical protein
MTAGKRGRSPSWREWGIVMRVWQIAAAMAAMMTTHVVPAAAETLVPAGLGGGADTGGVLGVTAQPGTHIYKNFWLRVSDLPPVRIANQALSNQAPRVRRVATMLDFYPDAESGFHLSAGMRLLSKRGRGLGSFKTAQASSLIYAPALSSRLPMKNNISRTAPAATVGWTTQLSSMAAFGLEAGTIMEHGGARNSAAAIAQPHLKTAAWSRIDPVAQVAFALKF